MFDDFYTEEECRDRVDLILDFFGDRPDIDFNDSFVIKMEALLDQGKSLTKGQVNALDNIIEGWKINERN